MTKNYHIIRSLGEVTSWNDTNSGSIVGIGPEALVNKITKWYVPNEKMTYKL